jgi:DNA-directed RNA polymerase omega subunit
MSHTKGYAEESIIEKVGGRFRLSALVQKRLQELNKGQRPMVEPKAEDPMDVVIEEIDQDKLNFVPRSFDDGNSDLEDVDMDSGADSEE